MADTTTDKAPYKDASVSIPKRVEDLLSRMTLAEKAGQLFHDMMAMGPGGTLAPANDAFGLPGTEEQVLGNHITHFNLLGAVVDVKEAAQWHNRLQELAVTKTRLGIPVTLSTDPRNHFSDNPGTGFGAGSFSQWPETLGFAALQDEELVEKFADMARQEYVAIGLRLALHPQVDLATEYRWARIGLTFGESAELSGRLGAAYVRGFQGTGKISGGGTVDIKKSVSTMVKHFPGGGPQKDGEDPHFYYGKEQVYPGGKFDYHVEPFIPTITEGTRWIMPYYGQPIGVAGLEEVGFGLNKDVITDLLRKKLGYKGLVCTDWGLVSNGKTILGQDMPARAWGCEHLSEIERVKKILDAGCDQFGGESRPEFVVKLAEDGQISEERINTSIRNLLTEKFELGLFDNPYVDVDAATKVVGHPDFIKLGEDTQRRSFTLLVNQNNILPLSASELKSSNQKIFTENIPATFIELHGLVATANPKEADLALIRLKAPFEPRPGGFESHFHAGSLAFDANTLSRLTQICDSVPKVVLDIYLDRPAVLTPLVDRAQAVTVSYGSSVSAFLDVVFGVDGFKPEGKLPFDLPRSMAAVEKSREDVPFDTEDPLFRFGFGLRYKQ